MLELDLQITARAALAKCRERGAVICAERELAGRPGSRHWHLRIEGRPGTLELNECEGRVWVKVHPLRQGDWAVGLARQLAQQHAAEQVIEPSAVIERPAVQIMFKRAADDQASITRAWTELEGVIGSLRGRKFYGTFDADGREYRACVQLAEGDDAGALGLELGTLPGGRYAQVRLRGEPPAIYALIAPTFRTLAQRADCDHTRPGFEFYRRRDLIDLLQPVT